MNAWFSPFSASKTSYFLVIATVFTLCMRSKGGIERIGRGASESHRVLKVQLSSMRWIENDSVFTPQFGSWRAECQILRHFICASYVPLCNSARI